MKHNKPTNIPTAPPKSKVSLWLLGLLGVASLLIVLQVTGIFKTVDRTQSTGWMDLKSAEYQNRPMPERRPEKPSPQLESTLQEIASEFEGQVFSDIRTANTEKGWGLSEDEAKFYDDMKNRYSKASSNWLGLVKRSYATYKMVKEAFGGTADVTSVLQDTRKAYAIYNNFQKLFGVSPAESQQFARSGQGRSLSDWANFIESKRQ